MAALVETAPEGAPAAGLIEEIVRDHTGRERFAFEQVEFVPTALSKTEGKDRQLRWGLSALKIERFRYSGAFPADGSAAGELLADLFATAPTLAAAHGARAEAVTPGCVAARRLAATLVSMEPFEALKQGPCTDGGYIKKCLDEEADGLLVQDELRRLCVNADDEHACLVAEATRAEFLWHLFRLLVVGGSMSQPDEYATDYLEATRQLYKELVSVYKSSKTGKITVGTHAHEVTGLGGEGMAPTPIFPTENPHNRCYVLIEPLRKTVTVVYLPFVSFW